MYIEVYMLAEHHVVTFVILRDGSFFVYSDLKWNEYGCIPVGTIRQPLYLDRC